MRHDLEAATTRFLRARARFGPLEIVFWIAAFSTIWLLPTKHLILTETVIWGLLVVFQTMYTAVLQRTREIGILKALGASPGYILGVLLREAVLLAVVGAIAGILMTYGTRALMHRFVPTLTQAIVPDWWWRALLISLTAAILGALYPGLKAARQDAIEALAYD